MDSKKVLESVCNIETEICHLHQLIAAETGGTQPTTHNNARDEICAHHVQFQDCVFFPGDVSCGDKACSVKTRRLSPVA